MKLLRRRIEEVTAGRFTGADAERVSFEDLAALLIEDYEVNGRRSLPRALGSVKHLRFAFGPDRATDITPERLHRYVKARLAHGAARATVQNELAALKRMFHLAVARSRLHRIPAFPTIRVNNAREEFFEAWEVAALLSELPDHHKGWAEFAYLTGWRVRSEVLPLKWEQVDFDTGVVRLRLRTTKNDDGRAFPFDVLPQLRALLERQRPTQKSGKDTWAV